MMVDTSIRNERNLTPAPGNKPTRPGGGRLGCHWPETNASIENERRNPTDAARSQSSREGANTRNPNHAARNRDSMSRRHVPDFRSRPHLDHQTHPCACKQEKKELSECRTKVKRGSTRLYSHDKLPDTLFMLSEFGNRIVVQCLYHRLRMSRKALTTRFRNLHTLFQC